MLETKRFRIIKVKVLKVIKLIYTNKLCKLFLLQTQKNSSKTSAMRQEKKKRDDLRLLLSLLHFIHSN